MQVDPLGPMGFLPARAWRLLTLAAFLSLQAGGARALDLAYSFEDGLQGYGGNGLGITVTQDTIGATEGTQSLKVDIVQGATFVGALTDELEPFIGDPPGLEFVTYDLTITESFAEATFVDAGITVFGVTQPGLLPEQVDVQAQFLNEQVSLGDLEVGTHQITMTLLDTVHPITFASNSSFNDIFGVEGGDPTDVIPTGFQIYINKSADSAWTGYIDNVRVGSFSDPNGGDYNFDGVVDAADYTVWRDNEGGGPFGDGTTTGDLAGVPDGVVDQSDYDYWAQQYGVPVSPATSSSIPEPASLALAGVFGLGLSMLRRSNNPGVV